MVLAQREKIAEASEPRAGGARMNEQEYPSGAIRVRGMITAMNVVTELEGVLSGKATSDPQVLAQHSHDASIFAVTPAAVVFPESADDIKSLVKFASDHPGTSLTPWSGGSDMSGGPLTESIAVDMNRHLNRIKDLRNHQVTVEPGLPYRDLETETLKRNLLLPSYPASKNLCTVGGMVANNSGGEKTLAFGKTEKYVKALKVVLSDGNEYTLRPLNADQAAKKMREKTFEGDLYLRLAKLINDNERLIQAARPNVSKNSSGYNLWDVWNGHVFDLTKLFVGSQGTLGIITEITFELITPRPHSRMLVMFLDGTDNIATVVSRILRHSPESFESYDDHTLQLALKFMPQMLRLMKKTSLLSLAWQLLPDIGIVLRHGMPKLVLIAEFSGYNEQEVAQRAQVAAMSVADIVTATRVTKSEAEAEKYWTIRRESFNLLRKKVKDLKTAPFIDDFIIQPKHLPEFLPKLNDLLTQYNILYTIAGHVGDGNFHIIPLMNLADEKQRAMIPELAKKVYDLVFEYKGSMSAEHNDGLVRSHFLPQMFGAEMYKVFEEVKKIFDPKNIFNPGKKVNFNWKYSEEHIVRN